MNSPPPEESTDPANKQALEITPGNRGHRLKKIFQPLAGPIILWLAWVVVFQAARWLLIGSTGSLRGDATPSMLLQSTLHGLRFDFAMATWLVTPFALWWIWRPSSGNRERRAVRVIFSLVALVAMFILIAEVEFYKEFQMRLGALAFEYFSTDKEHNTIIFGMIWHGYPVVRWTLACLAAWTLFLYLSARWFKHHKPARGLIMRGSASLMLAAFAVLSIRGGVGAAPLRWGDAFFSQNNYANKMALNGLWALMDAARHAANNNDESGKWKKRMPEDKAVRIVRETILLEGETLVDPEKYPLLRTSPPNNALSKKPHNVVLVMMESFSARFCDATGASFGATPNFAALARDGILFDHAFSVSTHTAAGVFGTLCSYPLLPDHGDVMKSPTGQQPFRSLPRIFSENGYETLFLYNGLFSWDNKEGFFRNQGVQRFIGTSDFVNPTFVDPDWGVSDHDVFQRAIQEFDALTSRDKPFFSVILTLSNHSPFNLPIVKGLDPIQGGGDQNQRLNGVHYADWAIGQFMNHAREHSWFDDTLFVFVGDHGFGVPPNLTEVNLLHMHVPLLFYAPALFGQKPGVRHDVASQLDILPTLIGLTGIDSPHQSFGRDLFRLPAGDPGQAYVKRTSEPMIGWIKGDHVFVNSVASPSGFHQFNLGFPPTSSEDIRGSQPLETEALSEALDAMVVTGLHTLEKKLAAP